MNSPAQKIKERLSIEEVVSSYIKLTKAGANLKAKCPFHNEKTPSFFVSPTRGSFYCFGCGKSGDIFSFVEEFEGLDFKGALKLLADKAGIPLQFYNKEEENEKDRLYQAMEASAVYFSDNLIQNTSVLQYLKSRGFSEKSVKDFRIGYALPDWHPLYSYLRKKGFTDIEIEKAGLAKRIEKAKSAESESPDPQSGSRGFYDRFRGRIMFPIMDTSGRVIAFSGRIFSSFPKANENEEKVAKYLNSPETPIFSKSAVLFGLHAAKESIRKNNFSILVEGQTDLILSHQAGYKNTVATSGTALSDVTLSKENVVSNLGLVRRLSPNIVLAFDADQAGFKATERAGWIALSLGMDVKIAAMPEGIDPADLISNEGSSAWKKAIKQSKHIIEFMLDRVLKNKDARKVGREIKETILPYLATIPSSIEKMYFIKKISELSAIPQTALQDDLKKVEQDLKDEKKEMKIALEVTSSGRRRDNILRKLLGIILWQKTLKEQKINVEKTLKELGQIFDISPDEVLKFILKEQHEENTLFNKEDLIFEAEVFYAGDVHLVQDVKEMLSGLNEEFLKEKLEHKMQELHQAEEMQPAPDTSQNALLILKEISEINAKIQDIKNSRLNNNNNL